MPINYGMNQLRRSMNHGAAGGGPQNMGLETRRSLAGGGNQPLHGTGPSLVPAASRRWKAHSTTRCASVTSSVPSTSGQMRHGAVQIAKSQAYIDRHAQMKRTAAVKASRPKGGPSFGSLSDGRDDPNQTGLLTNGNFSDVPSGSAIGTTRSPQQQQTSGGYSQVPNASSGFNRRGGPGY
jgi:hypothetical protein